MENPTYTILVCSCIKLAYNMIILKHVVIKYGNEKINYCKLSRVN